MSDFWNSAWSWLNSTSGMYGDNSFEGSVRYDSNKVTPVDSLISGKPVDPDYGSQYVGDSPVVPASDQEDSPRTFWSVSAPVNKPEYINAEFAKHYGMDVATAYQEALANTAHQREVKDLQAAGLNPVLAARYSGASGVSGASVMQASSGSGSGRSSSDSPISKLLAGAGLLAGIVAGIATKNPQVTSSVSSATRIFSDLFD